MAHYGKVTAAHADATGMSDKQASQLAKDLAHALKPGADGIDLGFLDEINGLRGKIAFGIRNGDAPQIVKALKALTPEDRERIFHEDRDNNFDPNGSGFGGLTPLAYTRNITSALTQTSRAIDTLTNGDPAFKSLDPYRKDRGFFTNQDLSPQDFAKVVACLVDAGAFPGKSLGENISGTTSLVQVSDNGSINAYRVAGTLAPGRTGLMDIDVRVGDANGAARDKNGNEFANGHRINLERVDARYYSPHPTDDNGKPVAPTVERNGRVSDDIAYGVGHLTFDHPEFPADRTFPTGSPTRQARGVKAATDCFNKLVTPKM